MCFLLLLFFVLQDSISASGALEVLLCMDADTYFTFQLERLTKKEFSGRKLIRDSETSTRTAIERAAGDPSLLTSSVFHVRFDPVGLYLPPLTAAERDEIVAEVTRTASGANSSGDVQNSIDEGTARASLMEWEASARDALVRLRTLSLAERNVTTLSAEEAVWRARIEQSSRHDFQQFNSLRVQTLIFLMQHPTFTGSHYACRSVLRKEEAQERWHLAVLFCGLMHAWDEGWRRLTIRLWQQLERAMLREASALFQQEVEEWCVILDLGRPIIDEHLDMKRELQLARERDMETLDNLKAVRREIIVKIHDRITHKEDYILAEKVHLVERILATQDVLLDEVSGSDSDPTAFERLHGHYTLDRPWLSNPDTPFGKLVEYHDIMLKHQRHGNDIENLPLAATSSVASTRWVADVPWDSPNRRAAVQLLTESNSAQESWKQYALDHHRLHSIIDSSDERRTALQLEGASTILAAPQLTGNNASIEGASPLELLYNRVIGKAAR